jgi:hypothetical protein
MRRDCRSRDKRREQSRSLNIRPFSRSPSFLFLSFPFFFNISLEMRLLLLPLYLGISCYCLPVTSREPDSPKRQNLDELDSTSILSFSSLKINEEKENLGILSFDALLSSITLESKLSEADKMILSRLWSCTRKYGPDTVQSSLALLGLEGKQVGEDDLFLAVEKIDRLMERIENVEDYISDLGKRLERAVVILQEYLRVDFDFEWVMNR